MRIEMVGVDDRYFTEVERDDVAVIRSGGRLVLDRSSPSARV